MRAIWLCAILASVRDDMGRSRAASSDDDAGTSHPFLRAMKVAGVVYAAVLVSWALYCWLDTSG